MRFLVLGLLVVAVALSFAFAAALTVGSANLGAYGGPCATPTATAPADESPYTIQCN